MSLQVLMRLALTVQLIPMAKSDARQLRIENRSLVRALFLWPVILTVAVFAGIAPADPANSIFVWLSSRLLASFFLFLFFLLFYWISGGQMGMGDVKLTALAGLYLDLWTFLRVVFVASLTAFLFGLILLIRGRRAGGLVLPFAPFVLLACLLTFLG